MAQFCVASPVCPVSPVHRPSTHSTHAPPHCAQVFEYPDKVGYMPADEVRYVLENLNEDLSGLEIEFMMNLVQQHKTAGNAHKAVPALLTGVVHSCVSCALPTG